MLIQHKQSTWIQTRETGGQQYSDTSPLSDCSLAQQMVQLFDDLALIIHFTAKFYVNMGIFHQIQKSILVSSMYPCLQNADSSQ